METIRSLDNNETIYNAEIYKGEFKVDINKLESTDFESYTDLDGWFEDQASVEDLNNDLNIDNVSSSKSKTGSVPKT